ncbi:MAG: nucleotidyl transferase AbiEii/AbiGii toxin family protein [Verrucomicrobia subdivision 3 bacterium]|nr:nucleotidyl transferase AbiEii/AbiGii toxin family protein [Limisphaerales bacterium]
MKNLAASIHARLAQRRAKTGEDFNVLLVRFTLERLLYRLSRSQHREQFILKGAMLFALWEPALHRVTRDLDLLGFGHPTPERLADIFREWCRLEVEADGVDFDARSVVCEDIRAQDEYAGLRVKLRATLGKAVVPLQVDVGFGDALPVAPEEITFPVLLGMAAPKLRAYARETVVAEKLEAIVKLGMLNSRFKDYFDLHFLAQKFPFEGALLAKSIAGTFARRGTAFPEGLPAGLTPMFATDPAKMRGWQAFWKKAGLKDEPPALASVVQLLVGFLERPLESAVNGKPLPATWKRNRWYQN